MPAASDELVQLPETPDTGAVKTASEAVPRSQQTCDLALPHDLYFYRFAPEFAAGDVAAAAQGHVDCAAGLRFSRMKCCCLVHDPPQHYQQCWHSMSGHAGRGRMDVSRVLDERTLALLNSRQEVHPLEQL